MMECNLKEIASIQVILKNISSNNVNLCYQLASLEPSPRSFSNFGPLSANIDMLLFLTLSSSYKADLK